jgi:hypothetical protein
MARSYARTTYGVILATIPCFIDMIALSKLADVIASSLLGSGHPPARCAAVTSDDDENDDDHDDPPTTQYAVSPDEILTTLARYEDAIRHTYSYLVDSEKYDDAEECLTHLADFRRKLDSIRREIDLRKQAEYSRKGRTGKRNPFFVKAVKVVMLQRLGIPVKLALS